MTYLLHNGNRTGLRLASDLDRMIDSAMAALPGWDLHYPAVDVRETGEGYILEAELPGLGESDVNVRVEDNLLILESTASENRESAANDRPEHLQRERRRRAFRRSFSLPKDVDREKIEAIFTNGLLVLSLHKRPEAKPRRIEITRG